MILKGMEFQGWVVFYDVSDQCSMANWPAHTPSERAQLVVVCSFKHFTTNRRDTECLPHIHVYTHSLFLRLSTTPWPSPALPPSTRTHTHKHTYAHKHTYTHVDHAYACFEPTMSTSTTVYITDNTPPTSLPTVKPPPPSTPTSVKRLKTTNKNHAVTSQHDVCYNVTTHIATTTINLTARTRLPSPPQPGPPGSTTAAPKTKCNARNTLPIASVMCTWLCKCGTGKGTYLKREKKQCKL